jgi:hypothetical protein
MRYVSKETNWDPKFALQWWDDGLLRLNVDHAPVRWFCTVQDAFYYVEHNLPDCSIEWEGSIY